ncbi:radical SAM protein [Candidatus Woesebacteria bacterium]|nr:radical SAM protein [Candidatus Woesebacteria bacterium]
MFGLKTKIKRAFGDLFYDDGLKLLRLDPSGITCNHTCVMCWQQQLSVQQRRETFIKFHQGKLNIDDYNKLIKSLPKSTKTVELVGSGEPLLFSDINQLILTIKQKGLSGSLITNGSLLTKKIRQVLIETKWDTIRFSMHAATAQTHKNIHGSNDFAIVIDNIRALLTERNNQLPWVKLLFVIQKGNYQEIVEFIKLAEQLGVDEIEFDYLIPTSKKELFLSKSEISDVKKSLANSQTFVKNNCDSILKMFENNSWSKNKEMKTKYLVDKYCELKHLEVSQIGITSPCCLLWDTQANKELSIKDTDINKIWESYRLFRKDLRKGKFTPDCINNCYYNLPKK